MGASLLTLLAAGSFQLACESPRRADLARLVLEITQAVEVLPSRPAAPDPAPTVRDIPFYFDDLAPRAAPAAPLIVTYDWRSPVVFDLP